MNKKNEEISFFTTASFLIAYGVPM